MSKLLARILLVLALLAPAIAYTPSHDGHAATPQQDMVLFSGKIVPVASADLTTLSALTIPSWLTPSRTGNAMQWDSTGKLTYAPNNLYINSGSATSTARTITTVAGVNYYIWIQTSSGSATIVASGTNTTTFNGSAAGTWTAFTATAGTLTLTPTSNFANITQVVVAQITYETALRSGDNVVTGASAYYGPRFDYDPSTLLPRGLLIEESRTNYLIYSSPIVAAQNVNPGWFNTGTATLAFAQGADNPTGSASAYVLNLSTSTAGQGASITGGYTPTYSTSAPFTGSIFWKNNGGDNSVRLDLVIGNTNQRRYAARFDFTGSNYAVTNEGGFGDMAATAIPLPNGWWRLIISGTAGTGTMPSGTTWLYVLLSGAKTSLNCYLWGSQIGPYSFDGSYIPTTGATVTRAADVVTIGGAAATAVAGSAGSIVLQTVSLNGSSPAAITNLVRGTNSIMYRDTTGKPGTTNGTNILLGGAAPTWSSALRTGLAWSAAGRSLNYTGGTVATDSNTASNGGTLYLGSNNGSAVENGWYQAAAFYNQRLPDATLKSISNVGASFFAANDDFPRYAANENLPIIWKRAM